MEISELEGRKFAVTSGSKMTEDAISPARLRLRAGGVAEDDFSDVSGMSSSAVPWDDEAWLGLRRRSEGLQAAVDGCVSYVQAAIQEEIQFLFQISQPLLLGERELARLSRLRDGYDV